MQPDVAYLGQKDAQQARIVQQLIRDLNMDLVLRVLPTIREKDGLAMSSRNQLLKSSSRRSSRVLFDALQEARRLIQWGEHRGAVVVRRMEKMIRQAPKGRVDYATVVDPESLKQMRTIRKPALVLLAAWVGGVRLIDSDLIE